MLKKMYGSVCNMTLDVFGRRMIVELQRFYNYLRICKLIHGAREENGRDMCIEQKDAL